MVPFERAMLVFYRVSNPYVTIALSLFGCNLPSNVSDAQINRGGSLLEQYLGRKGLTDVSQILKRSGRDMGLSCAKEIVSISSAV